MSRKSTEKKTRRHIWIPDDLWDWFNDQFAAKVGTSAAIVAVMRSYKKNLEAKAAEHAKPVAPIKADDLNL